jgi:flagellar hook protein FlgE
MSILNTSVSGMLGNSNWLSSISQNVANANTTGYKDVETDFSSIVDQIANGPPDFGGVSTSQVSLNSLQGNVVSTSTETNLAVQGAGFFIVSNASGALYLTRNGSFTPDTSGNLVNSSGYYLMGQNVQNGSAPIAANSLTGLTKVNVTNAGQTATPTTTASLTANLPSTDTPPVAPATYNEATSLVVYDNLGGAHTINLYFANTGTDAWNVAAFDASSGAQLGATTPLTFDPTTGALIKTSASSLTFTVPGSQQPMTLDLSSMTQLATSFNVTAATANGNAPSAVSGVSFATNGSLTLNFANGTSIPAYNIPLANVVSPDNLTAVSGGAYQATSASGPVYTGTAGGAGFGLIESSSLESSTVDLATELTNMIQAQSAYEANSKVFQTGANILDILNGLKP